MYTVQDIVHRFTHSTTPLLQYKPKNCEVQNQMAVFGNSKAGKATRTYKHVAWQDNLLTLLCTVCSLGVVYTAVEDGWRADFWRAAMWNWKQVGLIYACIPGTITDVLVHQLLS